MSASPDGRNPVGVEWLGYCGPRVVPPLREQPWAGGLNPVGIGFCCVPMLDTYSVKTLGYFRIEKTLNTNVDFAQLGPKLSQLLNLARFVFLRWGRFGSRRLSAEGR